MRVKLNNGIFTQIDADDFQLFKKYKFSASFNSTRGRWYVYNNRAKGLHRLILGVDDRNLEVDHINGDSLDNRRANLRVCTSRQNSFNRRLGKNSSTGFKGVCRVGKKYRAHIGFENRKIHIGMYSTPAEAAEAYNQAAKDFFGEFARLNAV